jgi:hypothetical protein
LSEKFAWEDFLRSLSNYLSQAHEPLLAPYMKRHALTVPESPVRILNQNGNQSEQNGGDDDTNNSIALDISALAEQAAQEALQAYGQDQYQPQPQRNGGLYFRIFSVVLMLILMQDRSNISLKARMARHHHNTKMTALSHFRRRHNRHGSCTRKLDRQL